MKWLVEVEIPEKSRYGSFEKDGYISVEIIDPKDPSIIITEKGVFMTSDCVEEDECGFETYAMDHEYKQQGFPILRWKKVGTVK